MAGALTRSAWGACRGGHRCACVRFLRLPLQSIADGEANSTEIYSLTTWRLAVWDHGVHGVGAFWDLEGESALGLGPWRVGAPPVLPSSAPRAFPFHSDPSWGPTLRQDDLIFVIPLQRRCLQIQSCSVVLGLGPDHTTIIRDSSARDRAGGAAPSASGGHRPHSLGPPCAGSPWTLPQPEQGLGPRPVLPSGPWLSARESRVGCGDAGQECAQSCACGWGELDAGAGGTWSPAPGLWPLLWSVNGINGFFFFF